MEIWKRVKNRKIIQNEKELIDFLKKEKLVFIEISYLFENLGEQIGLVQFFVEEEIGLKLASIIDPQYKPYKIYIRVAEGKVKFIELEGGEVCLAHYKTDEKMAKFEEAIKSLPLGITFRQLPIQ